MSTEPGSSSGNESSQGQHPQGGAGGGMPQSQEAAPGQGQQQGTQTPPDNGPQAKRRKRVSIAIFAGVILVGVVIGAWYYLAHMNEEDTDDAFIAGNVYQISPKIAGRLKSVPVLDNQVVKKGDILAEIEPEDQEAVVAKMEAALATAQAQEKTARIDVELTDATTAAGVSQATAEEVAAEAKEQQEQASLESAKTEAQRAQADFERYSKLSERAVSQQRLDVVRATAVSAQAALAAAQKRVTSAQADIAAAKSKLAAAQADRQKIDTAKAVVVSREAQVKQAQADLEAAKLNLSYTKIVAPADGRVTRKSVLSGDYVSAGSNMMALVFPDVWVIANYKETQLKHIEPGQKVRVRVDAYGIELAAHVDSIQAGSGAQFSLLPPQNATGNYVKVVQRVPVKIVFDEPVDQKRYVLGPGMSVVPVVYTK